VNTKALNELAALICRAQEQDRTPMGIAFAVDAAGRHMSPEVAAELERLRAEVAALREERHSTNEALDDAVRELRARREDVKSDGITQRMAPTQALRELVVDGEHYALVHHNYRTGRDLPETGRPDEWCTGCNTDHGPDECGYRPETGGAR